jgi:predicted lactoylglutathione lyase
MWINLPVKDVPASVAFFRQLGFIKDSACMLLREHNVHHHALR